MGKLSLRWQWGVVLGPMAPCAWIHTVIQVPEFPSISLSESLSKIQGGILFKGQREHQQQQKGKTPHVCKSLRHTQDCPHPGCGTSEPHTVELPCLCVRAGSPKIPRRLAFPGAKPCGAPRFLQAPCAHTHTDMMFSITTVPLGLSRRDLSSDTVPWWQPSPARPTGHSDDPKIDV